MSFGGLSVIGQSASMVRKTDIKVGDIVKIKGKVTKRFDEYQIIVNKIIKLN